MKKRFKISLVLLTIILVGLLIPQNLTMPVQGATAADYHPESFWYYPWGRSGTHKGVDVFAKKGKPVSSSTNGIVLYTGTIKMGGNIVVVLGPKWRFHYYAHLDSIETSSMSLIENGEQLGTVGDSGNAKGKPPHLHYSIMTPLPYFWQIDEAPQGWRKAFYLNPIEFFEADN